MKLSRLSGPPLWPRLLLVALLAVAPIPLAATPAQAAEDITDRVRAGEDIELDGDARVDLAGGEEITYGGVISGTGTFTVGGDGKLITTADSDFQIPADRRRQTVEARGEPWWWSTIEDPDPPAVTVEAGATLQYGDGEGTTGTIGHYPYDLPEFDWNALNHHVDGTFIVAVHGIRYHPGNLSGSGHIVQPRHTWDGLSLAGRHTFSGTLYNGTALHYSQRQFLSTMPEVDTVLNQGSFIIDTQEGNDTVLHQDFYSREWGNDINFHSQIFGSRVIMTGVYSWADSGSDQDPSLSDPGLNYQVVAHNHNKRGINVEGAFVQWGDGTDDRFFLPGNRDTIYINMHERRIRSHLVFDYNGPVTLSAPISGGIYHDTMDAAGQGDVTIAGTPGNEVTFADQQNYNGATTIETGAVLRLGSGEDGGDGWLLTGTELSEVVDDGALVVANVDTDIDLSRVSGSGSLELEGPATLTLTGDTSYTGPTTVSGGTLSLTGGTIADSERLELSGDDAVFDVSEAGDQTVSDLAGVAGSVVALGANALTVAGGEDSEYAGGFEGEGGLVKTGEAAFTYSGASAATGTWTVEEGALVLSAAELGGDLEVASSLGVAEPSSAAGDLSMAEGSALTVGTEGGVAVDGDAAVSGTLAVDYAEGDPLPAEIPVVTADGEITGAFDGLGDGAEVDVGGTAYRIRYEDGRVVLRTDAPSEGAQDDDSAAAGTDGSGPPTWTYLAGGLALALLLGLGLLGYLLLRRRRSGKDDATLELDIIDPAS
ncbi:autotransporter-associated beta strand repeat-containing protein [Glycomyces salinus]|uniref:autotransporter-associated beta strand repeat-containing protein n=1 Tax=Glycomyces salinus TaxID=980294 RepID=UPI0018EB5574|nr:autotransporter-associated beta strand repeat-containing protein [Glycomyces salinus]